MKEYNKLKNDVTRLITISNARTFWNQWKTVSEEEKEKNQKDLTVAQMDNQTKEQIEAAKQTSEAVKLQNDQAKTALEMLNKGV